MELTFKLVDFEYSRPFIIEMDLIQEENRLLEEKAILPQDCNKETLPEFSACSPMEFGLKTAISTFAGISSLRACFTDF